ncbi:YveK family protein [Litchfieldia alkalitelluris]|uniref:YveK family protein n=1 Tax=Litchfieldia alkalitelluris TaxID=304268 RepID=UPI0009984614|nr:Wzz/FepE/Etk N-terminal domain-containing protein [Litchfieldia alkalitelluris]
MEETISLKELYQTLRKRLWMIALITVIATTVSGVVSYLFLTPIYQSTTQILVNQKTSDQPIYNSSDIRTNIELINTYNVIIKKPVILDKVKKELNLESSVEQLSNQITVAAEGNSQVVNITVQDEDAETAKEIANTIAVVFQKEIVNLMSVDNVSILPASEFEVSPSPVKPQPLLNMAIALVVGLMIGVGLAFLLEFLDNTIKSEQDIEKVLGLPVLGAITEIDLAAEGLDRNSTNTRTVRGESVGS